MLKSFLKIFLGLLVFGLGTTLLPDAARGKVPSLVDGGFSLSTYQVNRLAGDDKGGPSLLGTKLYHLFLQANVAVGRQLIFSPHLRYTPSFLALESPEKGSTLRLSTLTLPLFWPASKDIYLGGGPILLHHEIAGKGGTKVLSNANTERAFGLPGRTVSTSSFGLTIESQWRLKTWLLGFDLILQGLGSAEKRSASFSMVGAYSLGAR